MKRQMRLRGDRIEKDVEHRARTEELQFFDQLVKARYQAGLTQKNVAQRMGTTATVVARLENGGGKKRHSPTIATLRKYAHAVGCRLDIRLFPNEAESQHAPDTFPKKYQKANSIG